MCLYIYAYYVLSLSLYFSLSLCTHIWVNYYNLTVTSLGSWLVRGIIPKWPYFRRRVDNVPRAFVFFFYFVFNSFAVLFNFVWLRLCYFTCECDFFLLWCGVGWGGMLTLNWNWFQCWCYGDGVGMGWGGVGLKLIPVLMLRWWCGRGREGLAGASALVARSWPLFSF